jgi:hypothetical protein
MWCYACSWVMRGHLTLNSMAQFHTAVTLLTSRDLTCQHASHISVVAHISRDVTYVSRADIVTSCFQKLRKCLLKKVRQRTFLYDTKSPDNRDQHMRANVWEEIWKELSSRDVRIMCPVLRDGLWLCHSHSVPLWAGGCHVSAQMAALACTTSVIWRMGRRTIARCLKGTKFREKDGEVRKN